MIRYTPRTLTRDTRVDQENGVLVGRHQEIPRFRFRSDRTFNSNGGWYFATRESIAVGPYTSRLEAEAAARELIEQLAQTTDQAAVRGAVIDSQTAAGLAASDPQGPVARTG